MFSLVFVCSYVVMDLHIRSVEQSDVCDVSECNPYRQMDPLNVHRHHLDCCVCVCVCVFVCLRVVLVGLKSCMIHVVYIHYAGVVTSY